MTKTIVVVGSVVFLVFAHLHGLLGHPAVVFGAGMVLGGLVVDDWHSWRP